MAIELNKDTQTVLIASVQRFKDDLRRLLEDQGPSDLPHEWNERLSTSEK